MEFLFLEYLEEKRSWNFYSLNITEKKRRGITAPHNIQGNSVKQLFVHSANVGEIVDVGLERRHTPRTREKTV